MVLVCPAVLQLWYWRHGSLHTLLIAFDVGAGERVVGLRIGGAGRTGFGASWSGWHGWWERQYDGTLVVLVHWRGQGRANGTGLRRMAFQPHLLQVMVFQQSGLVIFADTLVITFHCHDRLLQDHVLPDGWLLV